MTSTDAPRRGRPPSGNRDRILDATDALLREKGVARLTTKEIARRAEVSEGSIFYHYTDRSGLLTAAFERGLGSLAAFGEQVSDRPARPEDLRGTLLRFTEALERFLDTATVVLFAAQADADLRTSLTSHIHERDLGPHHGQRVVGEYLARLQEQGLVSSRADPSTVAFLLIGACMLRVAHPTLLGHDRGVPSREQVVDTFVAMLTLPQ